MENEQLRRDQALRQRLQQLLSDEPGSDAWWRAVAARGTPLLEPLTGGRVRVTFVWRDPQSDAGQSGICRVYIDVNSLTDHHRPEPQGLLRLSGTDLWCWQVELPADWRGSYAFMPLQAEQLPSALGVDASQARLAQRRWWRETMQRAQADPYNSRRALRSAWGGEFSGLHLPDAPDQSAWRALDNGLAGQPGAERWRLLQWSSRHLGGARRVWLFSSGGELANGDRQRPLVLLLDGQNWALHMPIYAALNAQTRRDRLPAALYVLIDSVDAIQRERDLACSAAFWQAIEAELLPLIARQAAFSPLAARTVVAGQSLGGLAAMYAGLHRPQRFGRVLSQSGSFWWPHVELLDRLPGQPCARKPGSCGWLAAQLAAGQLAAGRLRVFQEVGSREDVMIDVNDSLAEALRAQGHELYYRIFQGGHDGLCWRGGLLDGLAWLLAA